jgi:diketogulonate reductase-like aldo/keto reductase
VQVVIPKTANPAHMRANRDLAFALTEREREAIDAMDGNLPPTTS